MNINKILIFVCIFYSAFAYANETMYIINDMKVVLRGKAKRSSKQLGLVTAGDKISFLSYDNDNKWSKIRTSEGKIGWVMTRFLQKEKSINERLESLEEQHLVITKKNNKLETDNKKLVSELNKCIDENIVIKKLKDKLTVESSDYTECQGNNLKCIAELKELKDKHKNYKNQRLFIILLNILIFCIGLFLTYIKYKKYKSIKEEELKTKEEGLNNKEEELKTKEKEWKNKVRKLEEQTKKF